MKILITGGHVTPALAVVDELKGEEIIFVGRQYALSSDRSESFEYSEVKKKGIRFIDLPAGRLTRVLSVKTVLNFLKIPAGFMSALVVISEEKPDVVLTFGGYIALPIALAAFTKGIPVITHEQTIHPGSANRFIGKIAKKIFVSFPEAKQFFPPSKVVVSGNPVRTEISRVNKKLPDFNKSGKVLFISGGSLGSHDINSHIFSILPELLENYTVIHQTGSATEFKDFDKAEALKQKNYYPVRHIDSDHTAFVYQQADLVIGRAGANTIFELLCLKKPSLLIPLPWSAFGEQQKHAQFMKNLGIAEIFDQSQNSKDLIRSIEEMAGSLEKYRKNFDTIKLPYDSTKAAKQIAEAVLSLSSKYSHS